MSGPSGPSGAEILSGGPSDEEPFVTAPGPRTPWLLPAASAVLGLVVGAFGTHLLGSGGSVTQGQHAGPSVSASATTGSTSTDPGVVVPEVVDAQTLPGSGGMEVVAEAVPGASTPGSLRYDYRLNGAVWLAPDGTIRSGPPGCILAEGEPEPVQYLQVAVVHARAVAGGPNADRVIWYRCASFAPASSVQP